MAKKNKRLVMVGNEEVIKIDSNLVEVPEAMKFNKRSKSGKQVETKEGVKPEPQQAQPPESDRSPKSEPVKPLTLASLKAELDCLKQAVLEQGRKIADLESALARKRKPASNGKIQIRDKQTGKLYPSKNNAYQTLLRSGELKDLVEQGVFGAVPDHNNFGAFALFRTWPDRFEEVKPTSEKP